MRAGLIDEYVLATHPVLVGGGTPFFAALDQLGERWTWWRPGRSPTAWSLTRYETRR